MCTDTPSDTVATRSGTTKIMAINLGLGALSATFVSPGASKSVSSRGYNIRRHFSSIGGHPIFRVCVILGEIGFSLH